VGFARVAKTSGIGMLTTHYHAPRANAICERFLGSVRRECPSTQRLTLQLQVRILSSATDAFGNNEEHAFAPVSGLRVK